MHEMSLAESVLKIVERAIKGQDFARVVEIRLEIGALAGVEIDAMRFCMDSVLRHSLAQGAGVVFETVPGQGRCSDCGRTVDIGTRYDACPACGGYRVQPTAGTEMRVKNLLVE